MSYLTTHLSPVESQHVDDSHDARGPDEEEDNQSILTSGENYEQLLTNYHDTNDLTSLSNISPGWSTGILWPQRSEDLRREG